MPSETFLNLSKEKKENLISSAIKEFSENSYNNASINKIINRIKLPRGSFYMYFSDKEDLYTYIIKSYLNKFDEASFKILKEENGDFIRMCERLYDEVIIFYQKEKNKSLIDNFLKEIRFFKERSLILKPTNKELEEKKKKIVSLINKSLYTYDDIELLFDAYMFTMFTTINAIIHYILEGNYKQEKEIYLNRLHIIKYGIKKRG